MNKMLTVSLLFASILTVALAAPRPAVAKSAEEISPYPLGERSILSDRAISDRIKPVGSVCVQGQDCGGAAPAAAVKTASTGPRTGEQVFNGACTTCHSTGAAGAPKVGNKSDWAPRIAKGEDTLVKHALHGFNAMPPKGMCSDCSEKEIRNAIEYMIGKSQ